MLTRAGVDVGFLSDTLFCYRSFFILIKTMGSHVRIYIGRNHDLVKANLK